MNVVRETIKDKVVIDLIKRFLKAGVIMPNGLKVRSEEGAPQGGPILRSYPISTWISWTKS